MSRSLPPFDPRMPPATPGRHDVVAEPQRRRLLLAAGLAAGVTLAGALPRAYAAAPATVVASTGHGRVRGVSEQGVHTFKGIRYGADTAATRFQPPHAPAPWRGVADALDYGASAPQRGAEGAGSEDCLFLNVWTPGLDEAARRPVLVYFHGGGYDNGSGSDPLYDGTRLCRRGDVVVVTVNHRLNAFGYLHLGQIGGPELLASGNAGQLDLVLALQWVRDNIGRFGGDPGNVTVFGQSGGGAKIATLMAMPAARGLFQKAWTMSGQQVTAAEQEFGGLVQRVDGAVLGVGQGPGQGDDARGGDQHARFSHATESGDESRPFAAPAGRPEPGAVHAPTLAEAAPAGAPGVSRRCVAAAASGAVCPRRAGRRRIAAGAPRR